MPSGKQWYQRSRTIWRTYTSTTNPCQRKALPDAELDARFLKSINCYVDGASEDGKHEYRNQVKLASAVICQGNQMICVIAIRLSGFGFGF